jgi:CRP/FNR family cyclic AMP-dependent transcriptional regulator
MRNLIEKSTFFRTFNASIIDMIMPVMTECHYKADNIICLRGDESDYLYLIATGKADISVSSRDGKIIVLGRLAEGDVFGEIGLLDHGVRTATVTAKSDISLYKLSREDFDRISASFGLAEWAAITDYICLLFRQVSEHLEGSAFLDTNMRILKTILEIYEESPDAEKKLFKLNMSQESLGNMVGLSREATNKVLSKLEDQGLIERKYKQIIIPDIEQLQSLVDQEQMN